MDRRRFLAALASGSLVAASGCRTADRAGTPGGGTARPGDDAGGPGDGSEGTATGTTGRTVGTEPPLARQGDPQTICSERVKTDPGIYAVLDPSFGEDWDGVPPDSPYRPATDTADVDTVGVDPAHTVVGLRGEWGARAYPLGILRQHEVVNDAVGGDPVVVTYCPLCASGLVAGRVVDGTVTTFVVSGLLWRAPGMAAAASAAGEGVFGADETGGETPAVENNGNLVMYDRATGSYWSQILATAICGPARGTDLPLRPATVATWADWRADHPGTDVLLPPTDEETVDSGAVDPGTPPGL